MALIDRRAEEKRTTQRARAVEEGGQQRFRPLELEAPVGLEVGEAPKPQEEAPLRFPNAKAQRRLARTLDQFTVKDGVKPLITDYGYVEGPTLGNMGNIVRLHLGTCAQAPLSSSASGPHACERNSGLIFRQGRGSTRARREEHLSADGPRGGARAPSEARSRGGDRQGRNAPGIADSGDHTPGRA